jgi:hypothetical protein
MLNWFRALTPKVKGRERLHTVVFENPNQTLRAVSALRECGFDISDVHTPFPVHGIEAALGWRDTRIPWATFAGGAVGLCAGFGLQLWVHTIAWPLNIGGKTNAAWQALVPIGFEVTVLLAAFATVGALFWSCGLRFYFRCPVPASLPHPKVTDDRFVVIVKEDDGGFSMDRFRGLCMEMGALEVVEGWRVR